MLRTGQKKQANRKKQVHSFPFLHSGVPLLWNLIGRQLQKENLVCKMLAQYHNAGYRRVGLELRENTFVISTNG